MMRSIVLTVVIREDTMKLDKRVADLEAKGGSSVAITSHIIGVRSGQTQEQAKDTYGRDRIGPDDMSSF